MVSYSGDSRAIRLPNAGLQSRRQRKGSLGKPDKSRNRLRNSRVDSRIQLSQHSHLMWNGIQRQRCAQPGIKVVIAESLFQGCERWLSGAVAGGNVFDFEPIMQRADNLLNIRIGGYNKMKAARDEVNARIDCGCRFNDFVDTGMRTTNHNDQSFGGVDDQGEFAQFESTRLVGDQCDEMNVRCNFRILVHQLKISAGPS